MDKQPPTILDDPSVIEPALNLLKKTFREGKTIPLEFRRQQLLNFKRGIEELEPEIMESLVQDLGLDPMNGYIMSNFPVLTEINHALANLTKWNEPKTVETPLLFAPSKSFIQTEPLGVALIIGSWNVPYSVTLMPFASAIAAGNCCIIKPSEMAPYSSKVMRKLIEKYMDNDCYRCIEGQVQVAIKITQCPFDVILFTGSTQKGKLVAKAAAENLVPCILELGGKSPVVISPDADLLMAVKRIISFKFSNSGQICLGPDYAFVHKSLKTQFLDLATQTAKKFYGENAQESSSFSKIINDFHVRRLMSYMEDKHGGKIVFQIGKPDPVNRFFPPTLVDNPSTKSLLMTEEIFGSILPVLYYENISEVIEYVNSNDKPLSSYYFGDSGSKDAVAFRTKTTSGSFSTNDLGVIFVHENLPFGGVGPSGCGCVRGYYGFEKLVHKKAVVLKPSSAFWDKNPTRYPLTPRRAPTKSRGYFI